MYLLLNVAPIIFFTILVGSMVGMFVARLEYDNDKLALALFFLGLAMVIPMLASVQALSAHTEENLVVTESGKVAKVITNVHSVNIHKDVFTYTYRDGSVGQVITSIDRDVNVQNRHPYNLD